MDGSVKSVVFFLHWHMNVSIKWCSNFSTILYVTIVEYIDIKICYAHGKKNSSGGSGFKEIPHIEWLVRIPTLVLKNNNFISNGNNFTQINGTTMRTKMTLSCSHMALGYFFTKIMLYECAINNRILLHFQFSMIFIKNKKTTTHISPQNPFSANYINVYF